MSFLREMERRIDQRLRRIFAGAPVAGEGKELVEVQRAIIDLLDERVQMLPRARRVFPWNEVIVRVPVPDAEHRAVYELVFVADDALQAEILDHLRREGIEAPGDLRVSVSLVESADLTQPSVICRNREAPPSARVGPLKACFTLPSGATVQVQKTHIYLGRVAEVLDDRRRLVRRNDVIADGDTVSRAHAHIEHSDDECRLFDDGSSYGTSAIHEGRLIEVPKGGRGLRIHPGDEIYLGQVRIRFDLSA